MRSADDIEADRRARLIQLVEASDWFLPALRAVRSLGLDQWCIGAGALRNLVWDALSGNAQRSALGDIDVAFFAADDVSSARDQALQHRLCALMPGWPWEVTNQAGVHLWFEQHFGHPVAPLASLADAVATWPEYATAVAVTLEQDDTISIIAPYGLSDLFTMTVRHNPARASVATYQQRVAQKKYRDRWPGVTIIDAEC